MHMKTITAVFLAIIFTLLLISCKSEVPEPVDAGRRIIGTMAGGFSPKTNSIDSRTISGAVSTIASFGVVTGQLSAQDTVDVAADGSFSVPVDTEAEGDQVLLFADSTATDVHERYDSTGFIVLPTADGGGMSRIPVSAALVDTIDLGAISLDTASGLGFSSLDRDAQVAMFGLDFERLQAYYRFDNVLRMARNLYVNDDPASTQWIDAVTGQANHYPLYSIRNSYSSPTEVPHRVFSVDFVIKFPVDHTYADIAAGAVIIEVVPAADITLDQTSHVYGPTAPLATNDETDLGNGWMVMSSPLGSGSYSLGLSIDDSSGIPGGTWIIKKDGAEFALFDFSSLAPYDDAGHFLYFIPSVQASVETDGRVTRLDLKWYSYDMAAGVYAEVADPALLDEWIHDYGFGIGHTDSAVNIEEISRSATSVTQLENDWYFDTVPASGVQVSNIWVLYSIGSMSFSFNFNR